MSEYHGSTGRSLNVPAALSNPSAAALSNRASTRTAISERGPASTPPSSRWDAEHIADAKTGLLTLLPEQIAAPAFFVDGTLSIRWMADGGTDPFSRNLSYQLKTSSTRNVFNLIMRPAIKHVLGDWQSFFSFVYTALRHFATPDTFEPHTRFISREGISRLGNDADGPSEPFDVESCLIEGSGGNPSPQRLFCLRFSQGALFLLRSDHRTGRITAIDRQPPNAEANCFAHGKQLLAVLSARLNRSHYLAEAVLPELFFHLMNRIWKEADGLAQSLGGRRVDCRGGQICYVFGESAGRNPVFSAICCATRLNDQMALLEEKLRLQRGWSQEIRMNIGISHGSDDPQEADPRNSLEFVIPGGAFDKATLLSSVAGRGEVWITKTAMAQLPKKFLDQIVLGIDRQGYFQRNCFVPISDLQGRGIAEQPPSERSGFSIARVARLYKPAPDAISTNEG